MKQKIRDYLKRIIKLIKLEEMSFLPGHLAFYLVLMIIPVCSIIGVFGSNIDLNTSLLRVKQNIPNAVFNIVSSAINSNNNNYNMILFVIFSLWISSGGTKAIIVTSNLLFKIKDKDELKIRIKALYMVIFLFLLIFFLILVPVLGDILIKFITSHLSESGEKIISLLYNIIKYPVSLFLIFIFLKILYTIAPSENINSKYMNKGAIFTTLMWLILSRIYSYHLNNYSNYNVYYGSLSNILILLVWVYLLSYIFTIGIVINVDSYLVSKKIDF